MCLFFFFFGNAHLRLHVSKKKKKHCPKIARTTCTLCTHTHAHGCISILFLFIATPLFLFASLFEAKEGRNKGNKIQPRMTVYCRTDPSTNCIRDVIRGQMEYADQCINTQLDPLDSHTPARIEIKSPLPTRDAIFLLVALTFRHFYRVQRCCFCFPHPNTLSSLTSLSSNNSKTMTTRNAQRENIPEVEDQHYLPRIAPSLSETPNPPPVPVRPKNDPSESWLNATLVTSEKEAQTQPHHQHNPSSSYRDHPMQAQAEYKNEHVRSTTKTVELEPISPKSHNRLSTFLRDLDPSTDDVLAESQESTSSSPPSSPHRHAQKPHQVMLKRSSQLYPLNQSARQLKRHHVPGQQEHQHPYPELSRSNSNDNEKFEVNDEELKRLGQALKRKKEHDAVVRRASMSSMSSLSSASSEREMDKGESSPRPRPGVLTRAW